MNKGDLVRIVKRVPLPSFVDEDIGKFGIIFAASIAPGAKNGDWLVVLVEGKFQLHAKKNLEAVDGEG